MKKLKQILCTVISFCMIFMVMPDLNFEVKAATILLQTVDFESENDGYTITGGPATVTADDWWNRTNGTTVNADTSFSGQQGTYYFYGEDTDNGMTPADTPVYVTLDSVAVNGYSSLELKLLVAGNNDTDAGKEGTEYLKIQYSFNDGVDYTTRAQFKAAVENATCYTEDANADDTTDGADLSPVFSEFTYSIPVSASSVKIRIMANINSGR